MSANTPEPQKNAPHTQPRQPNVLGLGTRAAPVPALVSGPSKSYGHGIKRFILFPHKRHPAEMGVAEIEAFLTHLAVDR